PPRPAPGSPGFGAADGRGDPDMALIGYARISTDEGSLHGLSKTAR
ncbi:MAG: hypothetical protein AVDCRST_MAG26-1007, partial [uncultured Chloroflexia bacterium]